MKKFLYGFGIYVFSLAVALATAYWTGILFFNNVKYTSGGFLISRDLGFFLYGIIVSYPLFISLGLMAFLKSHRIWWTLLALVPIIVFVMAFGQELIIYSIIAAVVGGFLGILLSMALPKGADK
ncbi:MAG: hypothetical protein M1275_01115 [Patescibacteria group bacterium]|nr:hypothetical protein [Patescibacteria group bacterium]